MTAIRRPGAVSATVLIGLSASLVIAHAIAPDWSRRAGLDVWNLSTLEEEYRAVAEERDEMRAYAERAATRRATANQITAKLVSRTIPLPGAAEELTEVFREDEGVRLVLETIHKGAPTERHRFARHAIDRVKMILAHDPAKRDAVVAQLEAEYRAMIASPESPHAP